MGHDANEEGGGAEGSEHEGWGHNASREEGVSAEGGNWGTTPMGRVAALRGASMRARGTT